MSWKNFVIVAQPRTGSTFLHLLLLSHGEVLVFGELFNPSEEKRREDTIDRPLIRTDTNAIDYVENHVFRERPGFGAAGFTLFYDHARNPEWRALWSYLRAARVQVIHLKRRNRLNRFLSYELALATHVWLLPKNQEFEYEPIVIDPRHCFEDFAQGERWEHEADGLFADNPRIEVFYEDLARDPHTEGQRILTFLGLEPRPLSANSSKQRTQRQSEIIANFGELKETLIEGLARGRKWARPDWLEFFETDEGSPSPGDETVPAGRDDQTPPG